MFTICSNFLHYIFIIYSLYVHSSCDNEIKGQQETKAQFDYSHTIRSPYIHYVFVICSICVHCILIICSLYFHSSCENEIKGQQDTKAQSDYSNEPDFHVSVKLLCIKLRSILCSTN